MSFAALLAEVDRRIERRVGQVRGAVRAVVLSVTPTTKAPELAVEALADELVPTVELVQHVGFRSIPAAGAELVLVQIGGRGGHLVAIGSVDRTTAPTDLVAGDASLYASSGARVLCRADGSVLVEAPSGASIELSPSGTIALNGGGAGVARLGDACAPSAGMTAWIAAVSGALATLTGGAFPPPTDASYAISAASATVQAG